MNRIECPSINTVMVTHPFKQMPYDICPREEIAAPTKLLAIAQKRPLEWDEYDIDGHTYLRTWIQMRSSYPNLSYKVRSQGFYCATRDPSMFLSVLNVADEYESIAQWLEQYGKTPAIITTPMFYYRTKYQDIFYYITNTFPQRVLLHGEQTDLTDQMIQNSAYTICNGLTIAIAMHRLGLWSAGPFQAAFQHWLDREGGSIYTEITPDIQGLLVQHVIPHICDHPYYYAVMGRFKADMTVIRTLHESYEVFEPFILQQDATCQVVTNATIQMLPFAPMDVFDYVTHHSLRDEEVANHLVNKMDLGGMFNALFTQKGIWKRWQTTYRDTIRFLRDQTADSTDTFIYQCLRRTFYLYTKGSHVGRIYTNRIRKFWVQLIEVVDPKGQLMLKGVQRHIVHSYIYQELRQRNILPHTWIPKIPVAFLMEMIYRFGPTTRFYDTNATITVISTYPELVDIFGPPMVGPPTPHATYIIKKPLIEFMSKMREGTTIHAFYTILQKRAQDRLRLLRVAFMRPTIPRLHENDGYTIWTILQDYFQDHKEALIA